MRDLLLLGTRGPMPDPPDDPKEFKAWIKGFKKQWEDDRKIIEQNIQRLSTPPPRGAIPVTDVAELGYVLSVLWGLTADPPPDTGAVDWAVRPRMIPEKIRTFLKKFSFT